MGAGDGGGVQSGVLAARLQHALLNADATEEVNVEKVPEDAMIFLSRTSTGVSSWRRFRMKTGATTHTTASRSAHTLSSFRTLR